jgi:hypothetical protein
MRCILSWPSEVPLLERRYAGERRKVTVSVDHREVVARSASCDQAVDARTHGQARPTRGPEELDRDVHHVDTEGRLDDRQRPHRLARQSEGTLVAKPLQHLLQDGQAGDDLIEAAELLDGEPGRAAGDVDPG